MGPPDRGGWPRRHALLWERCGGSSSAPRPALWDPGDNGTRGQLRSRLPSVPSTLHPPGNSVGERPGSVWSSASTEEGHGLGLGQSQRGAQLPQGLSRDWRRNGTNWPGRILNLRPARPCSRSERRERRQRQPGPVNTHAPP